MRVPCCEHMGQRKGPWTPEEDQILISYIRKYGHENWRALPRQAGLLRCGKSCRLRWTNYLRPDIKRGNFSREEEENILMLHQILGNRWSAIAARLPGRTDNEIKNFWHTQYLKKKKKLQQIQPNNSIDTIITRPVNFSSHLIPPQESAAAQAQKLVENSPGANSDSPVLKIFKRPFEDDRMISLRNAEELHDQKLVVRSFFMDVVDPRLRLSSSFPKSAISPREDGSSSTNEDVEFWYNLFIRAGDQSTTNI